MPAWGDLARLAPAALLDPGCDVRWELALLLVLELPAVSIVYTWVFEHTKGSVLIAILLHAALNLCTVSAAVGGAGSWQLITLVLLSKWLLAGAVVLAWVRQHRRPVAIDQ